MVSYQLKLLGEQDSKMVLEQNGEGLGHTIQDIINQSRGGHKNWFDKKGKRKKGPHEELCQNMI